MSILLAPYPSFYNVGGGGPSSPLEFMEVKRSLVDGDGASVNIANDAQAGDLLLCMEHADNTGATVEPGSVPSGFTRIGASSANTVHQRLSWRIADGSEGTVTSGLSNGNNSAVHVQIYRSGHGVSSVSLGQVRTENDASLLPGLGQSLSASDSTAHATVIFAAAGIKNGNTLDFTTSSNLTSVRSYNANVSFWRTVSGYALYNGSPQDHVVEYNTSGSWTRPTAVSCYLDVTLN